MARGKKKESLTPEERLQAALVPESEQPYKVPENWCWVKLSSLSQVISKGTTPKGGKSAYSDHGVKFLRVENINDDGTISHENIAYVSEELHCTFLKRSILEENDILVSIAGTLGKTGIVRSVDLPMNTNQAAAFVRIALDKINRRYIKNAIDNPVIQNLLLGKTKVTSIPNLTLEIIGECPIPLPPFAEQQRIVDRIESLFSKLDEAKQKVQEALDSFETRKAAILHKAFTGELTAQWRKEHGVGMKSWENLRLENLIEGGPQNGLYKPQTAYGTGTKILRIDCFYEGAVLPWENLKRLALSKNEIEQYHLNINDIVINRVNSMAYLGKSALIRELPEECVFESNMMRITLNTRIVIPEYAIKYLNSVIGVQELRKNAKQAVNQASINQQDVKNVAIKLPKLDEQAEIVRLLDDLLTKEQQAKEAVEGVLEQIDLIKKAILARAFRGELGTNDPTEESAVKLLCSWD